ncbi:MAG: hypothetical protein M1453_08080 [Acidobacteria bacterium]|nr:hypothetical protein [Acidobacteriota bacterium]MCL5287935.1 hypothetical protein [Acidobacteriota bacterium]
MIRTYLLKIRMETPDGTVVVRSEQAIVGLQGIYIRGVRLAAGTSVLIRVAREKKEVSLKGITYADRSEGGVTVRWEGMSGETSRKLESILASAA